MPHQAMSSYSKFAVVSLEKFGRHPDGTYLRTAGLMIKLLFFRPGFELSLQPHETSPHQDRFPMEFHIQIFQRIGVNYRLIRVIGRESTNILNAISK